jgi:Rrf2 family iron-sulfur cluster assembly transcriptional regulator
MRLTTKGRYAVTAILDMVVYGHGEPVTLADIAQRESISISYLEQLFARLRRAGVVESIRGPGGGYYLALPAEQLTLLRVLEASGEAIMAARCQGEANCCEGGECLTHFLWEELDQTLHQFLEEKNFAALAEQVLSSRKQSRSDAS